MWCGFDAALASGGSMVVVPGHLETGQRHSAVELDLYSLSLARLTRSYLVLNQVIDKINPSNNVPPLPPAFRRHSPDGRWRLVGGLGQILDAQLSKRCVAKVRPYNLFLRPGKVSSVGWYA
jgi:hypothetical protein